MVISRSWKVLESFGLKPAVFSVACEVEEVSSAAIEEMR